MTNIKFHLFGTKNLADTNNIEALINAIEKLDTFVPESAGAKEKN